MRAVGLLDQRSDAFADRNVFLHFVLGLASAGRRFDDLLERAAAEGARRRGAREALGGSEAEQGGEDDEVLYFVLGLASFRARAGASIEALRSTPSSAEASADPAPSRASARERGGLLR